MGDVSTWSAQTIAIAFLAWAAVIAFATLLAFGLWTLADMFRGRE